MSARSLHFRHQRSSDQLVPTIYQSFVCVKHSLHECLLAQCHSRASLFSCFENCIVKRITISVIPILYIFHLCRFDSLATVREDDEESTTEVGSVMPDEAEAGPSREEVDAAIKMV